MRIFRFGFFFWLAVVLTGAAAAQEGRVLMEWERWLGRIGRPDAALVLLIEDAEIVADGRGVSVTTPLPLASNSKAITALCLDALVRGGLLDWNDALARWYPKAKNGLMVRDLVTHQSGLRGDSTQRNMGRWRGDATPRWGEITQGAFGGWMPGRSEPVFDYNNENYAVLGDLIERIAGEDYASACRDRVLTPLNVQAVLEPPYGGFGPWGGWSMSVRDYARLMRRGFVGRDPLDGPFAVLDDEGPVGYGLGMLARVTRFEPNYWHFGALCFGDEGHGAFVMNLAGRYTLVAAYGACTDEADRLALQQAMVRAILAD